MKKVHEILREKRIEKNIQQKYVAMSLGIPQTVVCDYERGRHKMFADLFIRWCDVLDLQISDFLEGNEENVSEGMIP